MILMSSTRPVKFPKLCYDILNIEVLNGLVRSIYQLLCCVSGTGFKNMIAT